MKNLVKKKILELKEFWKSIKLQKPHVEIMINGRNAQATLTEEQFGIWLQLVNRYFEAKAYSDARNQAQLEIYNFIASIDQRFKP